ncbi:hypothetical protein GWI33_003146, partial [Rhynchophorus ferrugineus]
MFLIRQKEQNHPLLPSPSARAKAWYLALVWLLHGTAQAQSLSYDQAEQYLLQHSYATQAQQNLQQAAQLEATALKGLGLPRIDLNARAYAFHSETDVPLDNFKQSLEDQLSQRVSE